MAIRIVFMLLLATALSFLNLAIAALQSVPELDVAMYQHIEGTSCVRLLTLSGEIGCGNPGRGKVVAPILKFSIATEDLEEKAAVLLPASELNRFLNRTLEEPSFATKVVGVLVEYVPSIDNNSGATWGISDDEKFPQARFAPYHNKSYVWNPLGSGIIDQHYTFPVYLLSEDSTKALQEVAVENQKRNLKYPLKVAELDMVMQTTKLKTSSSDTCLQESSCLPLGGYSVWSSLPPINASASLERPIVLAVSSMDSASFFRDRTIGADSPLSGLITLLSAVDALSKSIDADKLTNQLVFAVFTGEAWGYLGSRHFLFELSNSGSSVQGLNRSLIHQVVEIGSVGRAVEDTFYVHTQENKVSSATQEILDALQEAASSLVIGNVSKIKVESASKTNPGIPPSSLVSFVHANSSVAGVVVAEFDTSFLNNFYHSEFDGSGLLNVSSIISAASLLARTLYLLANDNSNSTSADIDAIIANSSLVEELVGCLLTCNPGMSCSLVNSLITPVQICPNHYVGVFLGDPSIDPILGNIDDTARFVWNFLADRTALAVRDTNETSAGSECLTDCANSAEICVGSTVEHKGVCSISTTRYVPAYSTRLQYGAARWTVIPAVSGDAMGEVDPVYTESYWKSLGVRVYVRESALFNGLVFLIGVVVTMGSFLISLSAKALFRKRLKRA